MSTVQFPHMRDEVLAALRSLADPVHQRLRWGVLEEGVNYYDDLTLVVHTLYDDMEVLPDPSRSVGTVLREREVPVLREVARALSPLLDTHGDEPDRVYLADSRWPNVVVAARRALAVMEGGE